MRFIDISHVRDHSLEYRSRLFENRVRIIDESLDKPGELSLGLLEEVTDELPVFFSIHLLFLVGWVDRGCAEYDPISSNVE